jgi:1-acyl-sn-glycerol-3-phosphate acyltransferase
MIRAFLLGAYLGLGILLLLPWLVLWSLITGKPDLMYGLAMSAVRVGNRLFGIRVHVEGLENIPPRACVFVANHVSNVDALAFIPSVPCRVAILIKKELMRIPILAAGMRAAQFVGVDRSDREAAAASVELAVKRLKDGVSFAIFAEGTRSPDGRLRPFKRGGFTMAIEAGVPVVPVSIAGTQRLQPKGEWKVRSGDVWVRYGPPVDASSYTMERRAELVARVESLVAAGLPPDQQPPA